MASPGPVLVSVSWFVPFTVLAFDSWLQLLDSIVDFMLVVVLLLEKVFGQPQAEVGVSAYQWISMIVPSLQLYTKC